MLLFPTGHFAGHLAAKNSLPHNSCLQRGQGEVHKEHVCIISRNTFCQWLLSLFLSNSQVETEVQEFPRWKRKLFTCSVIHKPVLLTTCSWVFPQKDAEESDACQVETEVVEFPRWKRRSCLQCFQQIIFGAKLGVRLKDKLKRTQKNSEKIGKRYSCASSAQRHCEMKRTDCRHTKKDKQCSAYVACWVQVFPSIFCRRNLVWNNWTVGIWTIWCEQNPDARSFSFGIRRRRIRCGGYRYVRAIVERCHFFLIFMMGHKVGMSPNAEILWRCQTKKKKLF